MKTHFGIGEDRDRGSSFAREQVLQKVIDGSAGAFIIRSSRDARDATVSVEAERQISRRCQIPRLSFALDDHSSSRRTRFRFRRFRMNDGGLSRVHFFHFIPQRRADSFYQRKNDRLLW